MTTHTAARLRPAFGTLVAIDAQAPDALVVGRGIAAAFEVISSIERLMHPSREGSDLALLAACPAGHCMRVHAWTWEVLQLCQQFNRSSRGIFDPCLDTAVGRIADLELMSSGSVRPRVPLRVDLGGIAKGYAVDRAIEALRDAGCDAGLVNAGGDLAAFGSRSRDIVCRGPHGAERVVELRDAALATSAVVNPSRPSEHRGYYHGVHRTPLAFGQVTVIAASAGVADALTKCLLFADPDLRRDLLQRFGAREIIGQKATPSPRSKRLKSGLSANH
jgi:thiamine biosynthesis lipoprotein